MHILNQIGVREQNLWRDPFDVQVVTMAGWPSCVAYRSKGDQVKTIGRAEVQVTWGKPIKPLPLEPTNWLGRRLRVEMMARLERKEKGMRRLKVATGLALAAGVMVSRPGLLEGLKEGPPEGCEAEVRRWYREFRGWFV